MSTSVESSQSVGGEAPIRDDIGGAVEAWRCSVCGFTFRSEEAARHCDHVGKASPSFSDDDGGGDDVDAEDGGGVVSWPSKSNRADDKSATEESSTDGSRPEGREGIPVAVRLLREEYPSLARMAISTVPGRKLRRECTREIREGDGSVKSRLVASVLRQFLRWFYDTEDSSMWFESSEGDELQADLPNSYNEAKAKEYYGRLKDIERELHRLAPKPHTAMLTLSASSTRDDGLLRPPADHLRGLQASWNPSVRRELQRVMEDAGFERYEPGEEQTKWWEYVTVVEPHGAAGGSAAGYGHFHTAVFASHELDEVMFRSVIDRHIDSCEYAERAAHDYGHAEPKKRPISVNELTDDEDEESEAVGNLGSYISEYIGGFNGAPSEREVYQLVFEAVCWSTGTQRVRFSNGANQLARQGRARRTEPQPVPDEEWDVVAIETGDGERYPPAQQGGQDWMVSILDGPPVVREDAEGLSERTAAVPG